MRIAVIGAGIVGVTSAWELAADGHEVTVFERRATVAAETSFANAGVIAPGYVTPWAAPGMPRKVLGALFAAHAPVRIAGLPGPATLAWLRRWLRACAPATFERNRAAMHTLATYSQQRTRALARDLALDHEQRDGYLVLLRTPREVQLARPGLKLLAEWGVDFHLVDAARCRTIEPALEPSTALAAGIHLPHDGVGNCRQFAQLLKNEAQRAGVAFRFEHEVRAIEAGPPLTLRWSTGTEGWSEAAPFDAVVVCAALGARALLKPLKLKLPLQPVYGYSVTAPMRHFDGYPDPGPRAGLMDEAYKVAITRLGQRIRVAGSAELGGSATQIAKAPLATLYKVLDDWFPAAAQPGQAQVWKGARPMLPDGPPLIGPAPIPGVWLNLGHGSSGWALACGSARVLADRVGGRAPAVDATRFALDRLARRD
jgi:D-amino-acid dehydrogenase